MIHQYKMGELCIVLDINSGSVHVVDELTYEMIAMMDDNSENTDIASEAYVSKLIESFKGQYKDEEVKEGFEEIKELINKGMLFTKDDYQNVVTDFKNRSTVVKALCLHVAHDCNLACKYCFASEGEYHGQRSLMSYEVGKQAFDFLVENSGNRRNLEVDFFGGEPLMNFDVVKKLVAYGRSLEESHNKNFRFTITTNGVLLDDEKIDFINKHMHNVVLSIDGRAEVNDRMRPSPNGKGSYDLIVDKFKKVAESREQNNYYVRGTFTHHNLDFAQDVLHLADLGFKQVSVEPVVAPDEMDYALKEEDVETLMEQYEYLAHQMVAYRKEGKDFNFFHFMIDLSQGPCVAKRLSGCGSGVEYLAVTPEGELFPCHQYAGMDEFHLGTVETGVVNLSKQNEFRSCNVYAKEGCSDCFARFYCSGGCSANAYNFKGDLLANYELGCELEKKRVECAIYLKAMEMLEA